MLISQPAFAYLEAAWRQLRGGTADPSFVDPALEGSRVAHPDVARESPLRALVEASRDRPPGRESIVPRGGEPEEGEAPAPTLSADQRRARAAALRASLLARQRRHEEAGRAFAEALALDPEIDLTEAPRFWELERAAHRAAADAYEAVGRTRDAMTLRGRIDLRFRPRLVRSA